MFKLSSNFRQILFFFSTQFCISWTWNFNASGAVCLQIESIKYVLTAAHVAFIGTTNADNHQNNRSIINQYANFAQFDTYIDIDLIRYGNTEIKKYRASYHLLNIILGKQKDDSFEVEEDWNNRDFFHVFMEIEEIKELQKPIAISKFGARSAKTRG